MTGFPPVPPGDALTVSATMYTTYRTCPDQALGRLHGEYPPDTRGSFKGNLAHRMFARHLRTGEVPTAEFDRACKEEIGQGMNVKIGAVGLRPSTLRGVISEVGELYNRFKRQSHEGFRAAEVFVEVEPAPGLLLRGSVDAVFDGDDDRPRLIDWKTGALGRAQDQLAFYALLWWLDTGVRPERVEAVSVATGERYAEVPTAESVALTAREVADLVENLRRALASGDRLDKVAGGWCRWCPILPECAEGRGAAAVFDA